MARDRRRRSATHFGLLLIDKPAGPTSHDLVAWVRWALEERAVGHCGTLDPAATGLLVVCVGAATKLVEHLSAVDKSYHARLLLGRSTTTADAQGETLDESSVSPELGARAQLELAAMTGALELPPPAYSAVKVEGRRAHEIARSGEPLELSRRPMAVHEMQVQAGGAAGTGWWIDATMRVAKGTYVRSLAQELGRRVGVPAHLGTLRRLACASATLEDERLVGGLGARELEEREGKAPRWRVELSGGSEACGRRAAKILLESCLQPPWPHLPFESAELRGDGARPEIERLLQGQRLRFDAEAQNLFGLSAATGLCAVVDRAQGRVLILDRDRDAHGFPRLSPRRALQLPSDSLT